MTMRFLTGVFIGMMGGGAVPLLLLAHHLYRLPDGASRHEKAAAATPIVHPLAWHLFKPCESDRELVFGPVVPEGEVWVLTSMCAKNNSGATREINVAVYNGHEWICLDSIAEPQQYDCAAWSGELVMAEGWRLGTWFRDATPGHILQSDATMTLRYNLV